LCRSPTQCHTPRRRRNCPVTIAWRRLGLHASKYEIRDLAITVGDHVAFGHSLNRISGTLKNGSRTALWVRWTAGFRKIDSNWLIAHDQVAVPFDFESGNVLLSLEP
jgi:ketosteroid isomerase-like protein